jgi:hypothetical protein
MANEKELRQALDEIANALQPALLLSTNLRRQLGERAEDAVRIERALDRAVRVLRRIRPTN